MILAWLCRFNIPNYSSNIIVIITFLDFHISMQLTSETGLFYNFCNNNNKFYSAFQRREQYIHKIISVVK